MSSQNTGQNPPGPQQGGATTTIVGILDLQVIVAPQGKLWVAQALEIDYAAAGESPEDAKKRFEDGLCATIHEHLRVFGTLSRLTQSTPAPDEWFSLVKKGKLEEYTQVSIHDFLPDKIDKLLLPFGQIKYVLAEAA